MRWVLGKARKTTSCSLALTLGACGLALLGACAGGDDSSAQGDPFIGYNISPDQDCQYKPNADIFIPIGTYDVGTGGSAGGEFCAKPYEVHFLLRGPELDGISADVLLTNLNDEAIVFDEVSPSLANPLSLAGDSAVLSSDAQIATLRVIPREYAEQLQMFAGSQIKVAITPMGTAGGEPIQFNPFVYPITICNGCLTWCLAELDAQGLTRRDVTGDECDDDAGADGRICIDPDC